MEKKMPAVVAMMIAVNRTNSRGRGDRNGTPCHYVRLPYFGPINMIVTPRRHIPVPPHSDKLGTSFATAQPQSRDITMNTPPYSA